METTILKALLEQSALVGLLAFGGWVLWKRYDRFTDRTTAELTQLRSEMKHYMEEDRAKMQEIIAANTRSLDRQTNMMDRNTKVMECMIAEIQDFKEDEAYKQHASRKSQHKNNNDSR